VNSTGAELLAAIAAGYEVMVRSSLAMNPQAARLRGWHMTGVCGTFGAAAACASLLHLNAEQTAWALGLAGSQSAGLWAFNVDGAMSKRLHPGKAAHSGVLAAELAQLGFSGPTQIYEAVDGGALKAFSDASDPAPLTDRLGTVFHLEKNSIKRYSSCGATHPYIDAALDLRKRFANPWDENRRIRAGVAHMTNMQCGFEYVPAGALNAQMSLRYAIAAAFIEGQVVPAQFLDEKLSDASLVRLSNRIDLQPDAELDQYYPGSFAGWVAVEQGGEWVRVDVRNDSNSEATLIDAPGVAAKFRSLNPTFPADEIASAAYAIEDYSARDFMALIRPAAATY
jgi:2-methylcitrate dehydratase PrpD